MNIKRIVLTGGPCAGKSTGLAIIQQRLSNIGYKVILFSEVATEVMNSGVSAVNAGPYNFQNALIKYILYRDRIYNELLQEVDDSFADKVVILYDRGIMDGMAYCSKEEFNKILKNNNLSIDKVLGMYDGVFHLVSAAIGAEEYYGNANNSVRFENLEEAKDADRRTMNCWLGHPHFRVINNDCNGFDQKMNNLEKEIMSLLGEPLPMEIERKYLIKMPNIDNLDKIYKIHKSDIIQTYLTSDSEGIERRIRQRGNSGNYSYYYTEKSDIKFGTRREIERMITQKEYLSLLMEADTNKKQIKKTRYCFVYKDKYFELDIYPFWNEQAILEIEVDDIDMHIDMPPEIEIIKDVTGDKSFSNAKLAER